jgi:hypothetical protein
MELHDSPSAPPEVTEQPAEHSGWAADVLPPADLFDPVIEAYKKDIDRTLLIENLRRSVPERLDRFQGFMNELGEMRGAALPPDLREKLFRQTP